MREIRHPFPSADNPAGQVPSVEAFPSLRLSRSRLRSWSSFVFSYSVVNEFVNRLVQLGFIRPNKRSVLPGAWYPAKDIAVDRYMADGRERQVSGHQRLAVRSQLPQKIDAHSGRLLGVVFEAVVPIGVFEPDLEHGVTSERQPVAAG